MGTRSHVQDHMTFPILDSQLWPEQKWISHTEAGRLWIKPKTLEDMTLQQIGPCELDPHLKRLGEYLAGLEVGWGSEDFDWLEQEFLAEPWLNWIKIVMIANSENVLKPFVFLSNTRGKAHTNFDLNKTLSGRDEVTAKGKQKSEFFYIRWSLKR